MSPVLCPALRAERRDRLGKVDVVIDICLHGLFYCGRANRFFRLGLDA